MHRKVAVDMSPEAIDQRLWDLGQLYELGVALREAKRIGPLKEVRAAMTGSNEKRAKRLEVPREN